ncbi:hypothetical protein EWM64_g7295 [Hericium alpestre]|uniref:Prolyl 4-hydroxylase alpha subunit Fe(2+) 2OG dioxygenase domain-containing protein n=1 Tax=Hericium alpestre TaxID=135208 RepID=A0A4Y9ZTA2_9AGAM|nr:hypothetical protein EWM64_g7295 [Hericium alpestre]
MSQPAILDDALKPLTDAVINRPPYVSGTLSLPLDWFNLFYKTTNGARYLNFTTATEAELSELAGACQVATFGKNREDVLDESYRKAGKMDVEYFANMIVPERTAVMQAIRDELLHGEDSPRPIRVELYKLNVYSEGSFFKAHVDTPRSEAMFGSLVLVFPTQHEGGTLIIRHQGHQWMFDSADAVRKQSTPSVGFVALHSDVEHEVSLVHRGHRVTLTYNLYFDDVQAEDEETEKNGADSVSILPSHEPVFNQTLGERLRDPLFLPDGGLLGFGLQHKYPIKDSLENVPKLLKGSDAVVWRAFKGLSLKPTLYFCYQSEVDDCERVLFLQLPRLDLNGEDEFIIPRLREEAKGFLIIERGPDRDEVDPVVPVRWVTDVTPFTSLTEKHSEYYGNEHASSIFYAEISPTTILFLTRVVHSDDALMVGGNQKPHCLFKFSGSRQCARAQVGEQSYDSFDDTCPADLKPLRDAIVDKPPYVSGTMTLPSDCFELWYSADDATRTDVLDESYRKAGKMDTEHFRTSIVPERTKLVNVIRDELLEGEDSARPIRIELYKLNVYEKGSFFKAHVDTPRSKSMFGSLVLVFPTNHNGGALILRHRGEQWTFDSAEAVAEQSEPSIGFVTFFSDVEHEVSMVNSGHRVTLTYNLYWDDIAEPGATVKAPTAVPANYGGRFGFGLRHVYPIKDSINHVHKLLKGSDAVVWRICQRFGMRPKIFLVYEGNADYGVEERVILSDLPSFGDGDDGMEYENLID